MILKTLMFIAIINCVNAVTGLGMEKTKTWTYELRSMKSNSSNTDLLNIDLGIERVSRGVFAVSGNIHINCDIVDDDANQLGLKSYRSSNGDGNYKSLPFQMPMTHIYKVINTFYKDLVMKSIKDCSNLPYFEDKFVPPLEKKTYILSKCQISQDGFPSHLQDGYYKLVLSGTGDVVYEFEVIVEVEHNN